MRSPLDLDLLVFPPTRSPGDRPAFTSHFEHGAPIVIGRDPCAHVVLDHPSVDGVHAIISPTDRFYAIIDKRSVHGTRVGGIPLRPNRERGLPPDSMIEVGDVLIEAHYGNTPFDTFLQRGEPHLARARIESERAERDTFPLTLMVVEGDVQGSKRHFPLPPRARPYRFGTSRLCDVVTENEEVSPEHIEVTPLGDAVQVKNTGTAVIQLGRLIVHPGKSYLWKPTEMLQVVSNVFALYDPLAYAGDVTDSQPSNPATDHLAFARAGNVKREAVDVRPQNRCPFCTAPTMTLEGATVCSICGEENSGDVDAVLGAIPAKALELLARLVDEDIQFLSVENGTAFRVLQAVELACLAGEFIAPTRRGRDLLYRHRVFQRSRHR